MKKKKSSRVSVLDIARAAGISKTAAIYALQNKPKVSRATRARVLSIAQRLGYAPDARIASWMARVQDARTKDLLPIAWLNTNTEKDAWHKYKFLSPYLEGARGRAVQLGYRLEEMWLYQPGMTMSRISKILYQRNIEGVIVTSFIRHFRLNWNHLACVSIEGGVIAPRLHRVTIDHFHNFLLAMKTLKRSGYRRVGICLDQTIDNRTSHGIRAITPYIDAMFPKSKGVTPLFYHSSKDWQSTKKSIIAWVRHHHPDVIVCHTNLMVQYVEEAGYRVPEDVGVVHLATDDDVSDWAGIYSNKKTIGAVAVDWVVSFIRSRQFSVPETALNMTVQGTWHPGRTLLMPKPK